LDAVHPNSFRRDARLVGVVSLVLHAIALCLLPAIVTVVRVRHAAPAAQAVARQGT
jgi:hypothetical protein